MYICKEPHLGKYIEAIVVVFIADRFMYFQITFYSVFSTHKKDKYEGM
jgi:hypothetical protein